jgi:hypothetical protein
VRPQHRQAEDVGGDLQERVAARATAGGADLGEGDSIGLLGEVRPLLEREDDPFEDRAVEMGARVDLAEADDGPLGGRGVMRAWGPVQGRRI